MEDSYQKLRRKYQSLDTDWLIELNRSGGLSKTANSALREELWNRGFKFPEEPPRELKPSYSSDKPKSNTGIEWTVWFRLISTLSIFFMMSVAMRSQPVRSRTVDIGQVLADSIKFVLIGPGSLFYQASNAFGVFISIVFWLLLIKTALGSRDVRPRRWFYGLLGMYIVLTFLEFGASIALGLVAMAGAM